MLGTSSPIMGCYVVQSRDSSLDVRDRSCADHGVTVTLGIAATALRLSHFSLATGVHLHFLITTLRQLALVLASRGAFERATRGGLLLSGVLW